MQFVCLDFAGSWVIVDGLDGEYALCRVFACFNHGREKLKLVDLANEQIWKKVPHES
jgi:hypothetical protein